MARRNILAEQNIRRIREPPLPAQSHPLEPFDDLA
jgi:hypothetical protein